MRQLPSAWMLLILRDALATRDNTFKWIGVSILVSYACYTPVIFWATQVPLLGMLMIPRTMAYLPVAFLAYRELYSQSASLQVATA